MEKTEKKEKNFKVTFNVTPIKFGQVVKDLFVFVLNLAITFGLFVGFVYLNSRAGETAFRDYFADPKQFLLLVTSVTLFMVSLAVCLYFDNRAFFEEAKNLEFVFLTLQITLILCYVVGRYLNVYLRPIALTAILSAQFFDKRSATTLNLATALILFSVDLFTNSGITGLTLYASLFIGFSSGILAVYLFSGVAVRLRALARGLVLGVPALVSFLLLNNFSLGDGLEIAFSALSGLASVVLYFVFLPILEKLFKKITDYRLAELTLHSAPLIKKLMTDAPGTFNHSITVANLAEASAAAIGENPLLARTCAYYHDVGKLRDPEFFKENQDSRNVHDELMPELSASIIKSHAKDGYDLLKKNGFPKEIANVCLEHHGTMPILYFYAKAKKFTDGEVKLEPFQYPGPLPQTKISAILMICDSSEAAARSLKDRSREKVYEAVDKIISDRIKTGQFEECPITMKEINVIRHVIVNTLTGIYHKRVEYPKVKMDAIAANMSDVDDE